MHHVTMVRMLSFYEYSTRFSTRRLRFEMAPKKKAAKDAATDIPQVCWCYSALNDPFEDLLIDPEIGDNVFTLGKMTPYCHYVAAQRDPAITTTPPILAPHPRATPTPPTHAGSARVPAR